jgi:hypothetical protein
MAKLLALSVVGLLAACTGDPEDRESFVPYEEREELTFDGYRCVDDCSGHEAGYEWAEEHGITDPERCGGNSESFIEGCMAFAEGSDDGRWDDEY